MCVWSDIGAYNGKINRSRREKTRRTQQISAD